MALGLTGPLLGSTGVAYDVRWDFTCLANDQVGFDVIVGTAGDSWADTADSVVAGVGNVDGLVDADRYRLGPPERRLVVLPGPGP